MARYFLKLFGRLLLTLAVVSTAVFFLIRLTPGGPAVAMLGQDASPDAVARLNEKLGLTDPVFLQYWKFLTQLAQGDLGESLTNGLSVSGTILSVLPHTLELAIAALIIGKLVGITLGIVEAVWKDRSPDVIGRIMSLVGLSFPSFFVAVLLVLFIALPLGLPTNGVAPFVELGSNLQRLLLPALAMGIVSAAYTSRVTRSLMVEIIGENHVRTARAKGVREGRVLVRHVLQPGSLPLVPIAGISFITLVGDAVLIETVFARPGLGSLMVNAMQARDYTTVQGCIIVVTTVIVLVNAAVDAFYHVLDPRTKTA
ncbi:ABC transporter permease [Streptosporangium saharense]|uniref:ABC-type dipeptide/oligopeptide/nickel transport system permease component n=1 Tax=Streptosporangium saharense TaxID=1706840 RepID=A0A7W7QHG3_9ACTN|nr:ABC transporter permease [Streptosporangium saharense]MBB4913697.1 ABC-type dipeptide/oligopeptide/nickel transport system permease component [Streptosporangium saharense]